MKKIIKVVTLCSGYDAQCLALERLKKTYSDFDYELVSWAEVDRYAIQAHNALFPQWKDRNMGDITSCDWTKIIDDVNLLTYSTPCQSISCAGKQEGLKRGSGTRSSIIWSVLNAIDALKPKYLLMENVKALVSKKFIGDFHEWQDELSKRGYSNFVKVLNSKCYGIPQNRERVFMVSILDENASFHFPEPFPLERRLKDILEEDVDEKYYLSDKPVKGFMEHNRRHQEKGTGILCQPKTVEDIANALRANGAICPTDNMIIEPRIAALRGRNPENPSDRTAGCPTEQRLEIGGNISNTVTTVDKDNLVVEPAVLTPKRNDYGKAVRKKYEAKELDESRHNMTDLVPRKDGICNTITSVAKDNYVIEPFNTEKDGSARTIMSHYSKSGISNIMKGFGSGDTGVIQIGNILKEKGYSNPQRGRIYSADGISPTINTMAGGGLEPKIIQKARGENKGGVHEICPTVSSSSFENNNMLVNGFLIRKLTEREVFRLMDVSEEDIDRIQKAGISRSQQYKMAGNSIVVSCLYHIFRKMFIDIGFEGMHKTLF